MLIPQAVDMVGKTASGPFTGAYTLCASIPPLQPPASLDNGHSYFTHHQLRFCVHVHPIHLRHVQRLSVEPLYDGCAVA
jgi:hypothetical protein